MKHFTLSIATAIGLAVGLQSCYYDVEEELYPTTVDADSVSWATDIQPLISLDCAIPSCHAQNNSGGLPELHNYAGVKAQVDAGRLEQRAVIDGDMPPAAPLTTAEKNMLQQWIADGAPQN